MNDRNRRIQAMFSMFAMFTGPPMKYSAKKRMTYECPDKNWTVTDTLNVVVSADVVDFEYKTMLEKLMCKFMFTISIYSQNDEPDKLPAKYSLWLTKDSIGRVDISKMQVYPVRQQMTEIVTTKLKFKDCSYFSFTGLFEREVWLCVILSMLVSTLLWSKLTRLNLLESFDQIFRTLTEQPITYYGHKERDHVIVFYVYLIPWLNCSSILTKCFLSILLVMYSIKQGRVRRTL